MSSTKDKINILIKQNDAIYKSLQNKNIEFIREEISNEYNDDKIFSIYSIENEKLKELSKQNKPVQVKEVKPISEIKIVIKKDDNSDEENFEEPKKNYQTITNMEEIKRAFFNNEYNQFEELVKVHSFKFYNCNYKYSDDKNNSPEFSARNLLKGFVRNLEDYRKYFLICFRCYKINDVQYSYPSYWILNSTDTLESILGSLYDDYIFEEINNLDKFLIDIRKIKSDDYELNYLIGEAYLH